MWRVGYVDGVEVIRNRCGCGNVGVTKMVISAGTGRWMMVWESGYGEGNGEGRAIGKGRFGFWDLASGCQRWGEGSMEAAEMMKSEIGEDDIGESRGGRGRWREVGDCAGGGSRREFRLSEQEEGRSGN